MVLGLEIGVCQLWSQGLVVNYLESYGMTQKHVYTHTHTHMYIQTHNLISFSFFSSCFLLETDFWEIVGVGNYFLEGNTFHRIIA